MHKVALLFLLAFQLLNAQTHAPGYLFVEGIPEHTPALIARSNQHLNTRSASFLDWRRDKDGIYITTRFGNTSQIHTVAEAGATRQQVTFFDEPVGFASADPMPGRSGFLFIKDAGGGEFYQIYYFDHKTGAWSMLTDGRSRNEGLNWSGSGKLFSFSSTRRNGKDADVWLMDPAFPEKSRLLTAREGSWYSGPWSPDDSRLVVYRFISANEIRPYIADVATGALSPLHADTTRLIAYGSFAWSGDGATLYYASDTEGDFRCLLALDLTTGHTRNLTPGIGWDVNEVTVSSKGSQLAYTTNEDGYSVLHLCELPSMKALPISMPVMGIIQGMEFDPDGRRLGMTINTATGPGDVYVMHTVTGKLERWTFSETGGLDPAIFVAPRLIRYETFDNDDTRRRTIPAFLYIPRELKGKAPVIIHIHGGPEGQSRPGFNPEFQYWVNELGCAVLDPNVRGSTGYGKQWLALDNGINRENSVKDIGALIDWIGRQPELDAERIAVIGGSYGGYMVLASLAKYAGRIRCGVDVVGISNFVTFLRNTESYRRDLRRAEYGDEREDSMREFLERVSPLHNAGKIRSPLFVAHGENDPRVPVSEARQIIEAVRKNGLPVWTMIAKDEGHGFRKKNNRDYYTRSVILFFQEFLLK